MNRTIVVIVLTILSCCAFADDKPIDIYEDIYNPEFWRHQKLIFNFEHEISGQSTIIEKRVEDIGKYIYRHPSTTPLPYIREIKPIIVEDFSDDAIELETVSTESAESVVIPEELIVEIDDKFESQKKLQFKTSILEQNEEELDKFQTSSPTTIIQALSNIETTTIASTKLNLSTETHILSTRTPKLLARTNQHSNRGRVKFNFMELTQGKNNDEVSVDIVTTDKANKEAPPVPTLSPWYDGFGKK